jgi:hypothetical protein
MRILDLTMAFGERVVRDAHSSDPHDGHYWLNALGLGMSPLTSRKVRS